MGDRNYNFPIPKNEQYYYDTVEGTYKPLILDDGLIPVKLGGVDAESGALPTSLTNSEIMQPIEVQGHLQTTLQTHNGVTVTPTSSSTSAWIDTQGFNYVGATFINDATTASSLSLQWSNDGVSVHGYEALIASSTTQQKAGGTDTKARYLKIIVWNNDTASPHVFSAWAYLKA